VARRFELVGRQRHVRGPVGGDLVGGEDVLPLGGELHEGDGAVGAAQLGHELEAQALAHVLGDALGVGWDGARLGDGLQDQGQVAHRDALLQQEAQDASSRSRARGRG
jgi:hypothetical protein